MQMKVFFRFQDVNEFKQNGCQELGDNPMDAQRAIHNDAVKRDSKALFLIHQSMDASIFDKISKASTTKEVWDILERCFTGGEKIWKVWLQALRR